RDDLVTGVQTCALPISLQQIRPRTMDAWEHLGIHREEGDCSSLLCTDRPQLSTVAFGSRCEEPVEGTGGAGAAARSPGRSLDDRSEERRVGKERGSVEA